MYTYLMMLVISAGTTLCNALLKKYQSETKQTFLTICMFNLVNAVTASVFFIIANRFNINVNALTLLFSFAAAIIIALNIIINVYALSVVSLVVVSIITTAGTIVGTAAFGSLFLNEKIEINLIFSIILLIVAVSLPFIKNKINRENQTQTKSITKAGFFICLSLFITSGLNVILNKLYVNNPNVCDSNSYFFMSNFILIIVCTCILSVYKIKSKTSIKDILHIFSTRQTLYVSSRTLSSNISAIITMIVLANMNVSLYAVLTTSFTLIGNALVSRYYFKENMPFEDKISIVLAIIAIILTY